MGAGKGWTSRRILETFPQVELTAVDVDPKVGEIFRGLSEVYGKRLHVRQADATVLPYARDTFDFVLAINVLRHLEKGERQKIFTELLRVLRPGGLLGLSEAAVVRGNLDEMWEEIKRRFSEENCAVLYVSTKGGFDVWVRKEYAARASLTETVE